MNAEEAGRPGRQAAVGRGDPFDRIRSIGVVPVIEISDASRAVGLARALVQGGVPVIEVTFRTSAAAESLRLVARDVPEILLIAGTVTTVAQAELAADAGAGMLVAPGLNRSVVERALELGVPMMPGVLTPSEVEAALSLGLSAVKVFPIEPIGGVRYLRGLAAPYTTMRWNPTGGITAETLPAYLRLPSVLACGGSWIAPRADIEAGRFEEIAARAAAAVRIVRETRETLV